MEGYMQEVKLILEKNLYNKLKQAAKEAEFDTIDKYIVFVLNELVSDEEKKNFDEDHEQKIKERLSSLGYLE